MTQKKALSLAMAALMAVTMTACGSDEETTPPSATSPAPATQQPPVAPTGQLSGGEKVIVDALNTAWTVHPSTEEPGASWDRARPMLDPEGQFPGQGKQLQSRTSGLGEWMRWQSQGVDTVAATTEILPDYHPDDTDDTVMRVVLVHRKATTTSGEAADAEPVELYATATKRGGVWLLSAAEWRG